jgi:hypothetical protein
MLISPLIYYLEKFYKMRWYKVISIAILVIVAVTACTTKSDPPENPFDKATNNGDNPALAVPFDSSSFPGIHQYILTQNCALAMCHDGAFEPDYRTVESAYATLVYQPVIKNSFDSSFTYRVVPYDTAKSWMYHRVNSKDEEIVMPTGRKPLSASKIEKIANWILAGCPDITGAIPTLPNQPPSTFGLVAFLPDSGMKRIDTLRAGKNIYTPFIVPQNATIKIYVGYQDANDDGTIDYWAAKDFTHHLLHYTTIFENYSNGRNTVQMIKSDAAENYPSFGSRTNNAPYFLSATLNTSMFNPGEVVYFKTVVSDGDEITSYDIPNESNLYQIQGLFSFKIKE